MHNLNDLARVNVIGASGSGKSTFARRLAALLGSKHIEMDAVFWEPNWTEPTDEVFFARLEKALAAQERWVLDGNYNRTRPIKWRNVTAIIWIDTPYWRTIVQSSWRSFTRALSGKPIWEENGNTESLRKAFFSKQSVILWTIQTHRPLTKRYEEEMKERPMIRLRSRREQRKFLENVAASRQALASDTLTFS